MRRTMRVLVSSAALLASVLYPPGASADSDIPSYHGHLDFNFAGPTAMASAAAGFANPAVYSILPGKELEYYFTDQSDDSGFDMNRWGLFWALKAFGFGVVHDRVPTDQGHYSATDYRLAYSSGRSSGTFGVALGWSGGDTDQLGRSTVIQVGSVERVNRYVSTGLAGTFATSKSDMTGVFDLALRPLGDQRLTVFGDFELPHGTGLEDAPWSAGAVVEMPSGLKLVGRYFKDESYAFGIAYSMGGVTSGQTRVSSNPHFSSSGDITHTNWGFRVGYPERNEFAERIFAGDHYLALELKGPIVDRRYRYFDNRETLSSVLSALEGAREDRRISGVALNLAGPGLTRGQAWEIRRKLGQVKSEGKKVIVFLEVAGMSTYHLASVADHVVMDPEGFILLPGYVRGRTYMANLLEKVGLGADEWRFKDYKSAMETLTRHEMSPEDREQRQDLVDESYETLRSEVAPSRGVEESTVDGWIDKQTFFVAKTAIDEGLVDELGRWSDVREIVRRLENGRRKWLAPPKSLVNQAYPSTRWGPMPSIAVVYAIGDCDLDRGIKARSLAGTIRALAADREVRAVVVRVNSPGGLGIASDMVAEAIKVCTKSKPVVVSMGDVAASGGYWISVYASEILAEPGTVTGSIGVIGGWVWDKGLSDKLGLEFDFVKRGDRADLFSWVSIPYLPLGVPHRPLTPEERATLMAALEESYDGFVRRVAEGRDMELAKVEELARGRVWTGMQAVENGLVDRIGGLDDAIRVAEERAGLDSGEANIVDFSVRGLINPRIMRAIPFLAVEVDEPVVSEKFDFLQDYETSYLKRLVESRGRPLFCLPPESMPREAGNPMR